MFKAIVNNKIFQINGNDNSLTVDGQALNWDVVKITDSYFHILHDNKSYRAEIVSTDKTTKTFTIKINNRPYTVSVKDKFDLLLEKMGINNAVAGKVNNIKAPMPGLIVDLMVSAGDLVKAGESLLILEAMKMENIIKSPAEGTVYAVKIKKGDRVEKGQILIEF